MLPHNLLDPTPVSGIAPFTTTTFEGIFPYLTSKYGTDIPVDLLLKVKRVYDIGAVDETNDNKTADVTSKGVLMAKVEVDCFGTLIYPGGVNKSLGSAEWSDV